MTKEQQLEKLRYDLAEAKHKARQYENRVKVLTNNQRDRERRERTRRLIEHGAILECVLPVKDMNGEEIKALLTQISSLPVVAQILDAHKKTEDRRRKYPRAHLYTVAVSCALPGLLRSPSAMGQAPNPQPLRA